MRKAGYLVPGLIALLIGACSKGSSSSSGPVAPTPPSAAAPASQSGCSATYTCPATDVNGAANPSTPTFDRLTVSTGTSSSCRATLHRNTPDPGIPIQFTIRNPQVNFSWRFRTQADNTLLSMTPSSGSAQTAGPAQANAFFSSGGIPGIKTGLEFSQNLILEIYASGPTPGNTVVAACGVTIWGNVPSGS